MGNRVSNHVTVVLAHRWSTQMVNAGQGGTAANAACSRLTHPGG